MRSAGLVLSFLLVSGPASAFELLYPGATCRGHEFLAVEAAVEAGYGSAVHDSLYYGIRYVDLGGMTLLAGSLSGNLMGVIHHNEADQHHHMCLRGGASDHWTVMADTAAWIRKLFFDALNTDYRAQQKIVDGGLSQINKRQVYTMYFLLGAALHAVQDSFAHGYRWPVWGPLDTSRSADYYLEWFGGREGTNLRGQHFYGQVYRVVLFPTAGPGSATHNHVYGEAEGGNFLSDKIWNYWDCDLVRNHLGNLQPHAFAAYLASVDFLRAFSAAYSNRANADAALLGFMQRWFTYPNYGFPGYGNPQGKCSTGNCKRLIIPGEK
jgi:hypothetical protein